MAFLAFARPAFAGEVGAYGRRATPTMHGVRDYVEVGGDALWTATDSFLRRASSKAQTRQAGPAEEPDTDRRIGLADRFYELKQRKSAHQGANHSHERMLVHMTHNVST